MRFLVKTVASALLYFFGVMIGANVFGNYESMATFMLAISLGSIPWVLTLLIKL